MAVEVELSRGDSFDLEVVLTIQVGSLDIRPAFGVVCLQQHHVAWNSLVFIDSNDIAYFNFLALPNDEALRA